MSDKLEKFIQESFGNTHGEEVNLLLTCHYIFSKYNDVEKAVEDYENNACFSHNENCPSLVLYDSKDETPKVQLFYIIDNENQISEVVKRNKMFITQLKNKYPGNDLTPRFQNLLDEIYEDEAFNFETILIFNDYLKDQVINSYEKTLYQITSNDGDSEYEIYQKNRLENKLDSTNEDEDDLDKSKLKFKFMFKNPNNSDKGESNTFVLDTKDHKVIVCALEAISLVKCYQKFNDRVFEQNIRYSLDGGTNSNMVNSDIRQTVSEEPDKFLIFNNGITIVSEEVGDVDIVDNTIELTNFSIVNGAQTISNLVAIAKSNDNNLDKVLVVSKIIMPKKDQYDDIVERITKSSNNQKPVKLRDFKSNSKEMKQLQETFKTKGVILSIKRGDKLLTVKKYIANNFNISKPASIGNDELGQFILSTILALPTDAKQLKNKLFEKKNYDRIYLNPNITNEMIFNCYQFYTKTDKIVKSVLKELNFNEVERPSISLFVTNIQEWITSFLWIIYNKLDSMQESLPFKESSELLDENGISYNQFQIEKFEGYNSMNLEDAIYKWCVDIYDMHSRELNTKGKKFSYSAFSYRTDFFHRFIMNELSLKVINEQRKQDKIDKLKILFK